MTFAGIKTALVMCAALFLICGGLILATATALSTATSPSSVGSPLPGIIPETAVEENKLPDELTNIDNMFKQDNLRRIVTGSLHRIPAPKYPTWSFKLEKDVYHPGEVICGRLTIKNEDPQYTFVFFTPWRGALVDNIEVWYKNKNVDGKLTRVSPFLKVLIGEHENQIRCGMSVILAPGGVYEALIPINTYWSDKMGEAYNEFYGTTAINESGEYQFYIRYLNWLGGIPHENLYRKPQKSIIYKWRPPVYTQPARVIQTDLPICLNPTKPIVLGPFNVKIEPWPTDRENEISRQIAAAWKYVYVEPSRDGKPTKIDAGYDSPISSKLVEEALTVFPHSKDTPSSLGALLEMAQWMGRYPYVDRSAPFPKGIGKDAGDAKGEPAILKDIRAIKANEKPGVLYDLICYWEIQVLLEMGCRSEALKVARENQTPDVMALLAQRVGVVLKPDWQTGGPLFTIPPDDYIDPAFMPIDKGARSAVRTNMGTYPHTPYPPPSGDCHPQLAEPRYVEPVQNHDSPPAAEEEPQPPARH